MKFSTTFLLINAILISVMAKLAPLKVSSRAIEGSYIVSLRQNTRSTIDAHLDEVKSFFTERSSGNKIESTLDNLGKMYHATFSKQVLDKVRNLTDVEFIEQDAEVRLNVVQTGAPWGLSRVSQRSFTKKSTYTYTGDGSGVTVYVIDTGLLTTHPEFEGRARFGARFAGNNDNDENGHGTHCAGTVGSKTFGVAKKVSLVGVRVLDAGGSGSNSGIIKGINWSVGDKKGTKGNVLSMSLGGGKSEAVNSAIQAAYNKGFVVVVAAGNESQDACNVSPASSPNAITVGASDINDNLASFSNYGKCVDVIAPGVSVLSTWIKGGTNTISGTSMATPHVAGLAAYYLSRETLTTAQLTAKIISSSTKNVIKNPRGTPNLLAYNSVV